MRWDDLRTVIGSFFGLVGLLLTALGVVDGRGVLDGPNLNLRVGIVMLIFAAFMLYCASRGDAANEH